MSETAGRSLEHYTLNTGHSRRSPRSEVGDHVIPVAAALLAPGEHPLPFGLGPEYRLVVPACPAGFWATLYRGPAPLLTVAVAGSEAEADAVWPALESFYLGLTDRGPLAGVDWAAPRRPAAAPWCAAVLVGPLGAAAAWAADLERCLAWAYLEKKGDQR